MKTYTSHKEVQAAKVVSFERNHASGGANVHITYGDQREVIPVGADFLQTHGHRGDLVGGYLVLYEDGYMSWSPAQAFEDGYAEKGSPDAAVTGLPVAGYKASQPNWAIEAVNTFKELEERTLRHIETVDQINGTDGRLLAIGRTQLQGAFMFLARAIFQPGRVKLPEDEAQSELDLGNGG